VTSLHHPEHALGILQANFWANSFLKTHIALSRKIGLFIWSG